MHCGVPNPLIGFYRDGAADDRGRTLAQILGWDDDELEAVHDYIQWLFPLPERSGANPGAPILDAGTIETFRATAAMRQRLRQALERMLRFYGMEMVSGEGGVGVERADNFPARARNWLLPGNHNHLRLTRMLRSLRLLGLEAESKALFRALDPICRDYPGSVSSGTYAFWSDASKSG